MYLFNVTRRRLVNRILDRVVQSAIKPTQERRKFCNFAMRFPVYCLAFCFEFMIKIHKTKAVKKHLYTRKIYSVDFLPWVSVNPFPYNTARSTTSKPDMSPRFNRKPAVDRRSN